MVLVLWYACMPLFAQDSLSLAQAIQSAVGRSATVQKAQLDVDIMRDRSRMEQSIIYPQVSGQYSLDYFPLLPTSLVPGEFVNQPGTFIPVQFGQPWQTTGQVSVSQLLYNEAYRRAIPARALSVQLSNTLLQKSKEEIAWQVAQLYVQIQQTEALKTTIASNKSRLGSLEKSVNASVQNGYAVKTDLAKVQLATRQLLAQEQQLFDALTYQKELLCYLLERPADTTLILSTKSLGSAISVQQTQTVEAKAIEQAIALQELQIRSVKAEHYPDIRAYASGFVQSQRENANFFAANNRWFGMGVVGLKAQFPIYDGGRLKQRIAQLKTERQKTVLDLKRLIDVEAIEQRNANRLLESAKEQVNLAEQSVQLAKEIYEGMQRQYREGTQPLKEVLDAAAALADAEGQFAAKQYGVLLAQLKYVKVSGRLLEQF
jgi:outer membrane protein